MCCYRGIHESPRGGGRATGHRDLAGLAGWGGLTTLSWWPTSRLRDGASRTCPTFTLPTSDCACAQKPRRSGTRESGASALALPWYKFCKATKKRTGNPWKIPAKRMSSSRARSSQGRLWWSSPGAGIVCSGGARKPLRLTATLASSCPQLKRRSVK